MLLTRENKHEQDHTAGEDEHTSEHLDGLLHYSKRSDDPGREARNKTDKLESISSGLSNPWSSLSDINDVSQCRYVMV